eukprot:TRINITY_DN29643_c0_g1_i1.p1 TRINITY_DN29643_c0_g1~~TRINITY_DN29643_c0_g1_i1.p1  ORF type:complete len:270 (+),score=31.31 TRINITY_DN29643_c0_g1_i1:232-1041(+)
MRLRSIVLKQPSTLQTIGGRIAPFPYGCRAPPVNVVDTGKSSVLARFLPNTALCADLANAAIQFYLLRRDQFPHGSWLATNSTGITISAATEHEVLDIANRLFPFKTDDFFHECVGCETLEQVIMDGFGPALLQDDATDMLPLIPAGQASALVNGEFLIRADLSFDGTDYQSHVWRHNSGASHIGVPASVISNPPKHVKLNRSGVVRCLTPFGENAVRKYDGLFIKVGGVVTKCPVLQTRVFLLGYPVLHKFTNILDTRQAEPVTLVPH